MKKNKQPIKWLNILAPLALLVFIVAALEIYVAASGISAKILPAPHIILQKLVSTFRRDLLTDTLFTLRVILIGYLIAIPSGILLAAICSQFKLFNGIVSPLIVILVVTPMITIVPLLMIWLGFSIKVRLIVVIFMAMPIIALNTMTGFRNVEQQKLELFRAMGANRFQTFVKLIFPNALPQVFTGLKLGCIFSTISAMSADLAIGKDGLGSKISSYSGLLNIEMTYGTIIIVGLIGIILFEIVAQIEKRVIVWIK